MKPYIIALTGASGVVYGIRLVQVMAEMGYDLALVISESARLVIGEEQGGSPKSWDNADDLVEVFGPAIRKHTRIYACQDLTAPIASGSYPVSGMMIVPCSMATLGAIANGVGQNLIHRAADCTLKEGRKLVMVPRETPLNAIHLENMLKLSRLGVPMVPAMPAFYGGVREVHELVDFIVGKVLDQFGIQHALYLRWTGSLKPPAERI
ncbi:MAG: UbiX family flavin prenyltransferase [Candidatus Omnitrophica bacterium]|nr:UbiX family flavin prenyltransferase [Candidatus Omnitrophota bacterium]